MPVTIGPQLQELAAQDIACVLGTVRKDGSVQLNPVWFEYADGAFWLNGGESKGKRRDWLAHVERDPHRRITLYFQDPHDIWRWAQVLGSVTEVTEAGAWEQIDRLSRKYLGRDYDRRPGELRYKIKVEPLRVTGANTRGRPWDVTPG